MVEAKCCVLVVDDDKDLRTTLAQVLLDDGYEVLEASNGAEALRVLHEKPLPDVILLDLMMPVMNGAQFRVAQQNDTRIAAIPVIVMTAAGSRVRNELSGLPAMRMLDKPIALDELLAAIEDASGRLDKRS